LAGWGAPTFDRVGRPDLIAKCVGHAQRVGIAMATFYEWLTEPYIQAARAALGDATFEELAQKGANTPAEDFSRMVLGEIDDLLAGMPSGS
jgi:hypothetical protein